MYCWNFAALLSASFSTRRLITSQLTYSGLGLLHLAELHDTTALGARAFKEDLRELDLASGLEELH